MRDNWLVRLGLWLARCGGYVSPPALLVPPALIERARALCTAQEQPGVSGEYKRHQVFARLIKDYPAEDRRLLSLAIELGLST